MKPRTSNSVADIAKFVAAGHSQSAANCRVLLDEIERLRRDNDRLEVSIGWLADVTAATAYSLGELKSTSKYERGRQALILEKTLLILDGAPAPTRGSQTGVRGRCERALKELSNSCSPK